MLTVGIDAGGTKTKATLYNDSGEVKASFETTTMHYRQVGFDGMGNVLNECMEQLFLNESSKEDVMISIGMPGFGHEEKQDNKIREVVEKTLHPHPFVISNDVQIAMAGALDNKDGIVVIAGTGSISLLKVGDKEIKCGGWGDSVGDEGSAFWLGKQLLATFSKQADGRRKKTKLYDIVMEELKLNHDDNIISYVIDTLGNRREDIAGLARLVYLAAQKNDPDALMLYDRTAQEIASMINTLAKQIDAEQINASYIGGVFNAKDYIFEPLKKYLDKRVTIHAPIHSAEYGAYLIGKAKQ